MRKRLFSILLAQCMVLSLVPTTAFAEDSTEETMNAECPVCGAEGALVENCGKYAEPAAEDEISQPEGEKLQENQDSDMPDTQSEAALAQMSGEEENGIAVQSAGVAIDNTNFPDANFCSFVASSFDVDNDNYLSDEEINAAETINCANEGISDLTGISHFTALKTLNCCSNQLTSLDVSKSTALTELDCYNNQLTSLDVSKNTALTELDCDNNQLTSLDVSKNTALTYLDCYNNQLTSLDVRKSTELTYLDCYNNQLTSLDVSKNTALTELYCYNNQLTSLDVSKNTVLTELDCYNNQLTSLDISNTNMNNLNCRENIYQIVFDNDRTFDLSTLPGNFDVAKTSDWSGGKVSGNTLTVESGKDTVTYKYDCGKGRSVTFTLKFVGLFADYTKVDEAITKANALNKDDYKDFTGVEAAVNAVVRGKNITEQSEVDAMAKAIEDAIAALQYKEKPKICKGGKEVKISNGAHEMRIHGKSYGTFTFAWVNDKAGWSIQNADGKYLSFDNGKLVLRDTAYVWKYDAKFYTTTEEKTSSGWGWWGRPSTKVTNWYLVGDGTDLSISKSDTNADVKLYDAMESTEHSFGKWTPAEDGKHTRTCTICGATETGDCTYENGACTVCGALDPDNASVSVSATVTKRTSGGGGWWWWNRPTTTTWEARITATGTGVDIDKVEYSDDGKHYLTGTSFTSDTEITKFYIRVTDSKGNVTNWLYENGKVTQK